jgi:tRNA(fMet)-specific endonuclease VapC
MGVLIDASILIEAERGRLDLAAELASRPDDEFHLSVVTASELLHGVHRATRAEVQATRAAFVEAVLDRFPMLDVDLGTARAHARLSAELATSGRLVGAHDLWLAAACLAHGLRIVTGNVREFRRVPGLVVEEWKTTR